MIEPLELEAGQKCNCIKKRAVAVVTARSFSDSQVRTNQNITYL